MSTSKLRRGALAIAVLIVIAVGWVAWDVLLLPSSFHEALFRYRLGNAVQAQAKAIDLAELASFEWEEVCAHHPYDGEFKHPKYGRTYQAPMNAAQDEVWVLLFIEKDGRPTYISGSCTRGGASIGDFGCRSRSQAILRLEQAGLCPSFSATVKRQGNLNLRGLGSVLERELV
ncbi:hypothetical protein EDC61_106117 [Sulfuritortus calidifontis]|uniref:Uncharacterized protein n=1 Tax=Sulfuritortus calidifontis TaxID=1914471 RepID=A0A4R3JW10_9PROT|nr:hypothetical protein [Sulfuritortus calidifontis]TCS72202.1 hypothetical protein EDC61_106117 [Sulfuritortus calidifontis]